MRGHARAWLFGGGLPFEVDCAAADRAVRHDGRGRVVPRDPSGRLRAPEVRPRVCEDDDLVQCVEGRWTSGALLRLRRCVRRRGGRARLPPRRRSATARACGPCGCADPLGDEVCDGLDNDDDGHVDEGVDCGVIDLVVGVVEDADGPAIDVRGARRGARGTQSTHGDRSRVRAPASGSRRPFAWTTAAGWTLTEAELRDVGARDPGGLSGCATTSSSRCCTWGRSTTGTCRRPASPLSRTVPAAGCGASGGASPWG